MVRTRLNSDQKLAILGLTLGALLLRIYRLDFQSYWIDEAWTVYFGNLPLPELLQALRTQEIHPPLYHPSTTYWIRLLGDSEFSLRYYSLIFSVVSIPLVYRLGKDLWNSRLGLIAALLMTVAPFQIWHAQEARMYSLLTAASAMSMWGFVNLTRRGGWRWWLAYLVGTAWAVAAHYHGFVLIGMQGLFLLLTWRRHWRSYWVWGGTVLLILAIYTPWFVFSRAFDRDLIGWLEQPALWETYARSAQAYSIGTLVSGPEAARLTPIFVFIYGLGLFYAARRRWGPWHGSEMLSFLISYTLAPNVPIWLYGEVQRSSAYLERYLISVQVGFLLTVAIGILAVAEGLPATILRIRSHVRQAHPARSISGATRLSSVPNLTAATLLVMLVGINGWVLNRYYFDPTYAKPDWRAVVRIVEAFSLPGDAILLTGDGGEKVFNYYYQGDLPVYYSFNTPVPPLDRARQLMAEITANHRRLWYTPYGVDIDGVLESWLAENSYPAWHRWLGRKRLALYQTQPPSGRDEETNVTFSNSPGQGLSLTHVALPGDPVPAGDLLPVSLTWETSALLDKDYQVSLRLINDHSDTFGQSDWPPLSAKGGTSTWLPAQPLVDRRSLWLPPDTPPGNYLLQVVVYEPLTGEALGQPLTIDNIAIRPAEINVPLQALPIPNLVEPQPPLLTTEQLSLVGYTMPQEVQAGQEMWLWLYWQARAPLTADPILRLSLASKSEIVSEDYPFEASTGSPDSWQPGQVRRAVYHLATDPGMTGAVAEVKVALISNQIDQVESTLGRVKLKTRPHQFERPAITHASEAAFGNSTLLRLIGYDLAGSSFDPGEALPVTLYWQAEAKMDVNYTVFIHMLNKKGQVIAQVDAQPQAGAAPTTSWFPGEILTDPYTLFLPPDLPPGDYHLVTGLYNASSGERLPVAPTGDFVELGKVTVN